MYLKIVPIISRKTSKIAGSGSGFIVQRHGSADPVPDLDPYQNVTDPQHC